MTKTGAFAGMLLGFLGCAVMKMIASIGGVSLPIYLDSFFVGLLTNIFGLIVGSALTQVTDTEKAFREKLFIIPEGERVEAEVIKTKRTVAVFTAFGIVVAIAMVMLWVIPYYKALA